MSILYPSNVASIPTRGYVDPSEVFQVAMDFGSEANSQPLPAGVTIAQAIWTTPTGMAIGDGATVASTKAGSAAPAAPTLTDSDRTAMAWFWCTDQDAGDLQSDGSYRFTLTVTVRLSTQEVVERSCYVHVVDR